MSQKLTSPKLPISQFETVAVKSQGDGKQKKVVIDRHPGQAEYFREDLNGVPLDMVAIPGGSFRIGSPEHEAERMDWESPQHSVTIAPFFMGKFAVTWAQEQAIVGQNPSRFKGTYGEGGAEMVPMRRQMEGVGS
jgi:formylglycine-generating enzyme required for sulfatase activity